MTLLSYLFFFFLLKITLTHLHFQISKLKDLLEIYIVSFLQVGNNIENPVYFAGKHLCPNWNLVGSILINNELFQGSSA